MSAVRPDWVEDFLAGRLHLAVLKSRLVVELHLRAEGALLVPVEALRCLFLVIMALVIIASIYLVGIILVSALMVIPGAIARNLTQKIRTMVAVSISAALVACVNVTFWNTPPLNPTVVRPVRLRTRSAVATITSATPRWNRAAIMPVDSPSATSVATDRRTGDGSIISDPSCSVMAKV